MDLGVAIWPVGPGRVVAPEPPPARDPDVPSWWTGENTDEFLASVGVVLE